MSPAPGPRAEPAPWKYVVRLAADPDLLDLSTFVAELQAEGVPAQRRYPIPLHRQPLYDAATAHCPQADHAARTLLSLPVHPAVDEQDLADCLEALSVVLTRHGLMP